MTHKPSSFKKAAMAIIMLTSSVAFAQNAPGGSFIPATGVGGGAAVGAGVGSGLSTTVIVVGVIAAGLLVAAASGGGGNGAAAVTAGTTGTR